ncbi:hypothetical protein CU098_006618 [Rhizopus stolonifer]|uniref:Velvet domain-containing protein n=1 Tax=Rhizopus stolonifer TaxID=4846 RepID=A0A367IR08_RHIST|nr:hypothetical protein CU098_006618 [Rhizopus stolonifer]
MSVTLVHSNTQEAISTQNILTGQTASSMYKLKDINNHDGGFFVFGDLSVKLEGQFRLKFSMFKITKVGATNLSSIYSDVFQVYSPKTFPGMLESTFLSRSFSDQGVRIRIRKEHRVQMNISRKRKMSTQEEEQQQEERVFGYPRLLHPYYHSHASLYHPSLSRQPQGHVWYNDHRQQRRRDIDIPTSHSLPHPLCLDRQPFADPTRLGYANRYDKFYYCNRTPPLHLSFMKPTEPTKPCRRQSAECLPYSRHLNESRRMSLQSHPMPSSPERIQLPPLRSMFTPQEDLVQVDAAVAMMQLASTLN